VNATPDRDGMAFFDDVAELVPRSDQAFRELRTRYENDVRLRAPPRVFNALTPREEFSLVT
jgi:hypothetical protein